MPKQSPRDAKPIPLNKKASRDWRGIRLAYPMTVHTPKGDNRAEDPFSWLVYNVKSREQLVMDDAHFRSIFAPRGKSSKESSDWQLEGNWDPGKAEEPQPAEQEGQPEEDA